MKKLFILTQLVLSLTFYGQTTATDYFNKGNSKYKSITPVAMTPFSPNKSEKSENKAIQSNKEAIEDYTKAIELNPGYAEAYYKRGITKYTLLDNKGAIADFNKTVEINPKHDMAYLMLAGMIYNAGDIDGGCRLYKKAIELGNKRAKRIAKAFGCK